jgi:hypothetical protein
MLKRWLKKPGLVMYFSLILALTLAVACGSAARPEPAEPQATAAPAVVATQAPVPTAAPQAVEPAGDSMMAGIEHAPSFAEFWQPPHPFTESQ